MKKTIHKTIELKSQAEKIWNILHQEKYTLQWYSEFSEGSHAVTDWKKGSKVIFKDESGGGLAGIIAENNAFNFLSIEYKGIVIDGKEDYESEGARSLSGYFENYSLQQKGDSVLLDIKVDMAEEYYDYMSAAWDRALVKIKQLAATSN